MAAAYDTYDYPSYWVGREYEHESEVIALKAFLDNIPEIDTVLEIGAGFGRLSPHYIFRARKVILTDPSAKLLKIAAASLRDKKNVRIIQSKVENLPDKVRSGTIDLVVMVRVLHHIEDLDTVFAVIKRIIRDGGYLILEFPNKRHLKATINEFLKGNLTFTGDIFPKEIKGARRKKESNLPFLNYHPDIITHKLEDYGFKTVAVKSVSNIRSSRLKKFLPLDTLLFMEKLLQDPLSRINFGPSIFIFAQKT